MSYIQRELEAIRAHLVNMSADHPDYAAFEAAQQALAWASDPAHFKSPHALLTGECIHAETFGAIPPAGSPASN